MTTSCIYQQRPGDSSFALLTHRLIMCREASESSATGAAGIGAGVSTAVLVNLVRPLLDRCS